jgi:tricorn protease-like protein
VYNLKTNTVTTSPKISTKQRENSPAWSPDGKWLYYISAPAVVDDDLKSRNWTMYSLCRIPYDTLNNTWGDVDTVLSAKQTGLSISAPILSPDGRYVLFCMAPYGYFTVFDKLSDLYILDLKTNKYHKLDINSESAESYHCWSHDGRWIVFSSKRIDDMHSRPYFAYFDKNGKTSKPFLLPQKDPDFYFTFDENYNRPELIKGKINLNPRQVRDLIYSEAENVNFDTSVNIDALSGATWIEKHPN